MTSPGPLPANNSSSSDISPPVWHTYIQRTIPYKPLSAYTINILIREVLASVEQEFTVCVKILD